jgi:hypothetical protein
MLVSMAVMSCSDDNEVKRKGDPDIKHEGTKWNITSVSEYSLSDVGMTSVTSKTGSASNAGSFFFNGETKGSFEMTIEGYNKEDFFNFEKDADGNIFIFSIDQSVGSTTNQNVLSISGEYVSDTEIALTQVSIIKQSSTTGIFTLTATRMTLVKE